MARRPILTEAEIAARVDKSRRDERRFGTISSLIGGGLLAIIFLVLIGGGLLLFRADDVARAGRRWDAVERMRETIEMAMLLVPALVVLFSLSGLILGEQMRRGKLVLLPLTPQGERATGTVGSTFTPLGTGWHVLWSALGTVICGAMVALPAASWVTGGWPYSDPDGSGAGQAWVIYGALGFGIAIASWVSLLKKTVWIRAHRRHPDGPSTGPHQRVWRWITYRWRFDLWVAGLGATVVAFSVTLLPAASAGDERAAGAMTLMLIGGVVLVLVGGGLATQFWRSGEWIGTGESLS